jgi:hypothetical protein
MDMYAYHVDDPVNGYPGGSDIGGFTPWLVPLNYSDLPMLLSKRVPALNCPDQGACWQDASGMVVGGPGSYWVDGNDGNDYFAARVWLIVLLMPVDVMPCSWHVTLPAPMLQFYGFLVAPRSGL